MRGNSKEKQKGKLGVGDTEMRATQQLADFKVKAENKGAH